MIRRTLLRLIVVCATSVAPLYSQQPPISEISRAVVRVVALERGRPVSSGSGTIVRRTGLIYTNRHVVEGGDDFEIEVLDDPNEPPTSLYRARLVGYSRTIDFALLQIDRHADGRALTTDDIDLPFLSAVAPEGQRGDRIFVFGYPAIGDTILVLTEGTLSGVRNGSMNDRRMPVWYATDAQISPGNSGGVAVNARGEIVGIPTLVRREETTGGRLGGILAIGAVQAALDLGLESDRSGISDGTTTPVIEGGRLDYDQRPHFGSVDLAAGFTPDPYTLDVVSGGEVNAGYLGGECTGHAAVAPDFRLNWSGRSSALRILFAAEDGGDAALLVNLPDGRWVCNDDASGGTFDPMVTLRDPTEGQYDVWVSSYTAGAFVQGTLHITERDLDPTAVGPSRLNFNREAYLGSVRLRAGFTPDPYVVDIVAGGPVDASYLGGDCVGFASQPPDIGLTWTGRSQELRILFAADDGSDTTLLLNLPDGTWVCNDDANGSTVDPMVILRDPAEGQYDVWVGTYKRGAFIPGKLSITELVMR